MQTPRGVVTYDGDATVDGVPGSGAPIVLNFLNAAGAKTGKLLPTGNVVDIIDDVEVSCAHLSSPLVFATAVSLGKTAMSRSESSTTTPTLASPRGHTSACRTAHGDGRCDRKGSP